MLADCNEPLNFECSKKLKTTVLWGLVLVCIICVGEHEINENNPLTDEHIVPEFLGGKLVTKNVCKTCNSNLGSGFEGRLANSFYFKILRQIHGIKGKQARPPNAFLDDYEHDSLGKIRVNDFNKIITFPEVEIVGDSKNLNISLKIDKSDELKAKKIVLEKLKRHFKSSGKKISDIELEKISSDFFGSAEVVDHVVERPTVSGSFSLNINDHTLLHLKIAYELIVHDMGLAYLNDSIGRLLRSSLFYQSINEGVSFTFLEKSELKFFLDDDNHWVYIRGNFCLISIFGEMSSLIFTNEKSSFCNEQGVLYKFDVASGKTLSMSLIEHISNLRKF